MANNRSRIPIHTHAVVLNLAARADGSTGRLDGRPLFAWKMAPGAQHHRALAKGLRQFGFAIEVIGKNGIFEVAGVEVELCAYFSARRKEIVDELGELGLETADTPSLAAAKALIRVDPVSPDSRQLGLGTEAQELAR